MTTEAEMVERIKRDANPNADRDDAFAAVDAEQRAEDQMLAKSLGIEPEMVAGAREHGMDPQEYAAFYEKRGPLVTGGATEAEILAIEADRQAREESRRAAEHERLVERARKRLAGE